MAFLQPPWRIWLLFTLWSFIITYPLPFHLTSHLPLGSEPVPTVPLFNLWTLQWNIQQLTPPQSPPQRGGSKEGVALLLGGYWDAPIFAPLSGTFAFSEPQPLTAWLALPLWHFSPVLAYNAVFLLFLTLNGWFTYWLLRAWGVSPPASWGGGFSMVVLPALTQELGVLQLTPLFGFLWTLRFIAPKTPHPRKAIALALGLTTTFLTCGYYGLFSLFFLPFTLTPYRLLRYYLLAFTLAGFLIAPFILTQHYHLKQHGLQRRATTITQNSAQWIDYVSVLDYNLLYGQGLGFSGGTGQRLFPGLGVIFLAILGLIAPQTPAQKKYLVIAIVLAWGLSFGLRFHLAGYQPYQGLRDYIPGLAQLRSPFRFALFMQLHLVLLAAWGLHFIYQQGQAKLYGLALTFILAESLAWPLPLFPYTPQPVAAWQVWLSQQPHPTTLVMLPFAPANDVAAFEPTVRLMLAQPTFQAHLVNGYSGFFPPDHAALRDELLKFPTPQGLTLLRAKGVNYVLVDYHLPLAPRQVPLPLVFWDNAAQVGVYRLD